MLDIKKFYLLKIITFFCFFSLFSKDDIYKNFSVKNINVDKIKDKENFYKNIFDIKPKINKSIIVTTSIFGGIFLSYMGFKYWNKNRNNYQTEKKVINEKTSEKINISIEELEKLKTKSKFGKNFSIKKAGKYGLSRGVRKGISNGIMTFISLGVLYIATDILKPIKNKVFNFFKLKDKEHFFYNYKSLQLSLKTMQDFFILNQCYKEEIVDNYNFFIENAENFLAVTSAICSKKIIDPNIYQSIKNEQNLMFKNIFNLSDKLNNLLNKSADNTFNFEKTSDKSSEKFWNDFKLTNNQIIRFMKLSRNILYAN
ncbi:hypothetical protein GF385_04030 [Candidatus Dependentiae bacterium]|nr:hypothetical protein [Candidatus Dependentiae bacterium]